MPAYKALIFDMNQLVRWEPIEAADDVTAVTAVPDCGEAGRIEVWRGSVRLATIRCAESAIQAMRPSSPASGFRTGR
jgi:hypothetical protein